MTDQPEITTHHEADEWRSIGEEAAAIVRGLNRRRARRKVEEPADARGREPAVLVATSRP